MDFQIKENEDSIKKEDNNKVKPAKRPISLTLVILLGVSFLLFLLISIFASGTENFSIGVMMLPFIIFMPISLIISFIFIFINRQKNKKRTNGFIISSVASFVLIILAIIFMTVFTNHLETANSLFENKKYEQAITQYNTVIKENKILEDVAFSKDRIIEAQSFIDQANNFLAKGDSFHKNNQLEEALVEYKKALEIYPYFKGLDKKISGTQKIITQAKSYMVKGDDYFQDNLFEKAIAQYNKALKIYPSLKGLDIKVSNTKSKIEVTAQSIAAQKEIEKINSTATELAEATTTIQPTTTAMGTTTTAKVAETTTTRATTTTMATTTTAAPTTSATTTTTKAPATTTTTTKAPATTTTETTQGATDSATLGEKNAASKALDYLAYTSFSYSGLVEQLKFDGYTQEEAVYGVDRCGADWNKQAASKALDYLAYTSFSYSGLVEQLKFDGYTQEEAVYGVDRCGADWNKQAALKAKQYIDYTSFSRDSLIAQLEFDGFTRQQAEYGVQAVGY